MLGPASAGSCARHEPRSLHQLNGGAVGRAFDEADVLLTTHGSTNHPVLTQAPFHRLIIDESHLIPLPGSKLCNRRGGGGEAERRRQSRHRASGGVRSNHRPQFYRGYPGTM